jgi:hypothetical protein
MALATPITPVVGLPWSDMYDYAAPSPVYGLITTASGLTIGCLENWVFADADWTVYTYIEGVTPVNIVSASEFNTHFGVNGFNGMAGYWDPDAAGVTFDIDHDPDGTLDWEVATGSWDAGELVYLWYQSTAPPGWGDYNLIDGDVGTGSSYAPVPEPMTLMLVGGGLLGLAGIRRKFKK